MSQYLPFSGNAAALQASIPEISQLADLQAEALQKQLDAQKQEPQLSLEQLDRETVDIIDLSVDTALALKIPFGATENKLQRRIYIQEYKKYREITEGDQVIHTGIAIRWVVNILKLNNGADLSSLPMVTASAEFNSLKASVRFEVIGLSSSDITNNLPSNVDLKTETYVSLKNAFEKIKSKIWDKDTKVHPTILGLYANLKTEIGPDPYTDAVTVVYALNQIKEGRSLARSYVRLNQISSEQRDRIAAVYWDITGSNELEREPGEEAVRRAKELLK